MSIRVIQCVHPVDVMDERKCLAIACTFCPRGGGALGYLGGCIRSLSKLKNTPKALISGQKSTLILIKR